jgi:PhzF family phenazine biosynthesis protein
MQTATVRCFGAEPGKGNMAMVIENGPANREERQAFARNSGHSACVFLDPVPASTMLWEADYFYPHARSALCLHASLAAGHVLLGRHPDAPVTLRSAMRGQSVPLQRSEGAVFAIVDKQAVAPLGVSPALAADLLGERTLTVVGAPLLSSVGSPKLLIEVADRATLLALQPPLQKIVDWGKDNGVNGCYVYCRTGEQEYEGRNFNHLDPAREDTATGVAAGALSAWLGHGLVMRQGAALGNPCRILTRLQDQQIHVGGATEAL